MVQLSPCVRSKLPGCTASSLRASSRLARQWRKLYRATKLTDQQLVSSPAYFSPPRSKNRLGTRLTRSLVAKFPQHSVVACSTQISCCRERTLRTRLRTGVCEPLMPDVVASRAQSQLRELSGPTFGFNTQGFSMVGDYTENLEKPQNCQKGVGTCSGQYGRCKSTITCILKPHPS